MVQNIFLQMDHKIILFFNQSLSILNCLQMIQLGQRKSKHLSKYSGYGISFDVHGTFSLPNGGFEKTVVLFGANMSS